MIWNNFQFDRKSMIILIKDLSYIYYIYKYYMYYIFYVYIRNNKYI